MFDIPCGNSDAENRYQAKLDADIEVYDLKMESVDELYYSEFQKFKTNRLLSALDDSDIDCISNTICTKLKDLFEIAQTSEEDEAAFLKKLGDKAYMLANQMRAEASDYFDNNDVKEEFLKSIGVMR